MSSGVALFASTTVTAAAVDGISPSTMQSVPLQSIDGAVYMRYGSGSRLTNLHRVRHIEGVCEKIHKGTVRVGFWVGKCAGQKSANVHTGWPGVSRIYVEEIPPPQA